MKHEQATTLLAAERYVLNELSAEEREQFEEHFFECGECAQDVRALSGLQDNARQVFQAEPAYGLSQRPVRTPGAWESLKLWLFRPSPAFAAGFAMLALTMISGWQAISMRRLLIPQVVSSYTLRPETRGEVTAVSPQQLGPFALFEADLPGASGPLKWQLARMDFASASDEGEAAAPEAGATFKLLFPSADLRSGDYRLTVTSAAQTEKKWTYRFRIR